MKKALSIVLSVAMLMTALFIMPASAEDAHTIELLNPDWISNGAEYVTVNEDGTWTLSGGEIEMIPDLAVDFNVYYNIIQNFTSTAGVSITLLDRDPNGVYEDHWINLYSNWVGPDYYEAGDVNRTDSIAGVFNWNINNNGWTDNGGIMNLRAIYITPAADSVVTLTSLALNDGVFTYWFDEAPEFETTKTFDLAVKDVDTWEAIPVSGSRPTVAVDENNALTVGNTAGSYPSAYIDFAEPIIADPATAMVYADFTVAKDAATTIYLFFGEADCNNFDNGAYVNVHDKYGADITNGNYKGYISLADIVPADCPCYDENGNLKITGIKVFAVSNVEAAIDPAVTIDALTLMYNEPVVEPDEPDFIQGDYNLDGTLNMIDSFLMYTDISKGTVPADKTAVADYNGDGNINMIDAFLQYAKVSGK